MGATQIKDALAGEDLIGIDPELLQQVDAGWLQRLSLFTGRALSDTALTNEQLYRAGRLTMLGQAVTAGTVQGLDLSVNLPVADPVLMVTPGYGISAAGQDVTLTRSLSTTLSGLAVLDGLTGSYIADFKTYTVPAGEPWAGVLLLQAIVADVSGSAVDTGSANLIVSGNLEASCDQDPAEYAFGDSQIVDGSRLVLLTWPSTPASLALPAALPAATWRNRLAYTVFNAETALAPDDRLPWEFLGVPLALAGFDASSRLLFADRSTVVRAGGLPRRRYVVPGGDAQNLAVVAPALANARVDQLAEQLGQVLTPSSVVDSIASEFAFLPPAGVLPSYTMNFAFDGALWCPPGWTATAAPVYTEELEGVLRTGITAAPLDTTANEVIEILVPLPDAVYDPDVLVTEAVDPVFQQEVNAATLARNVVLQHRKIIQLEANALAPLLSQQLLDPDAGLTPDELAGRGGISVFTPDPDEAFGTAFVNSGYVSTDLQNLQAIAAAAPYVVTINTLLLTTPESIQIPFLKAADWADLQSNGLQHFMNRISARVQKANDILDLGFLTAQTDIYRFRQNVLGTADATRLAVSPILANIATGDTATATAQNIQDYMTSLGISSGSQVSVPGTAQVAQLSPAAASSSSPAVVLTRGTPVPIAQATAPPAQATPKLNVSSLSNTISRVLSPASIVTKASIPALGAATGKLTFQAAGEFTPISVGTAGQPASPTDITQELPVVGGSLNVRTLTIASRLTPPPAQDALLYSVGNRVAITQLLAALEITIDDLPVLVDTPPANGVPYTMSDLRPTSTPGAYNTRASDLLSALYNPQLTPPNASPPPADPDAADLFSAGVHVLEQHTQLLRAVEGRVQQYQDFLSVCSTALNNLQSDMRDAQIFLTQLGNDLTQTRQNLAFVNSLLADETARVANVNATRANVLATYVQFVAYTRPRTLIDTARTPSRQLLPANVASPVPACLTQSAAIPPELSEMVALLREAPVYWFPSIESQIAKLERPTLLQNLAVDTQTRASAQLQTPLPSSSATAAPGVYSASITAVYSAGQQTFRSYQTQRAAFNPGQLASQSWSAQVASLQSVAAVADLMSSSSVYTGISNTTARSLQQISSVATCLYTRVGGALPADRLEWAEFLQNIGGGVGLTSLAVLPGWNSQDYTDRQQMQLLVDWLFQQIDSSNRTARALMSDLIAVAILLASNAPVDNIIAGAVSLRANATVGGTIRLSLPSDRVGHGMNVQLYSGAGLTARAVVTDLDSTGVTATITDVYKTNVAFQPNDVAHYTALNPNAVVYKAFSN